MNRQLKKRNSGLKLSLTFIALIFLLANVHAQQPELIWFGTLGGNSSEARAVSTDGSVVVGVAKDSNGNPRAFRWSMSTGIQDLGTLGGDWSESTDVSADGSVIVGWANDHNGVRAFRWTETSGMQDLGTGDFSKASAVSADGSVIIVNINQMAYKWTQSGGLQDIGNFGGNWTDASDVSSDGSMITGFSRNSAGDPYAFRWVEGAGMEQIGTFYSFAQGISGDGNTITGFETGSAGIYKAFRWTQSGGFEFNIAGNFSQGNALSGDGSIIVGYNGGGAFRLSTAGGLEELNQVYSSLLTTGSDLYIALGISSDGQFIVGQGTNGTTGVDEGYLIAVNGISSVEESQNSPEGFALNQNYPNPFNPSTTITFSIPSEELVSLKVFNSLGEEVAELINETKPAGNYSVSFDAGSHSGEVRNLPAGRQGLSSGVSARGGYASGVYFYKIIAGSFVETKKMILLR